MSRLARLTPLVVSAVVSILVLAASSGPASAAAGSGVNGLIYYTASDGHGGAHVWAAKADGTEDHQVTTDDASDQGSPSISPDGQTVAYTEDIGSNEQVFAAPVLGGAARNVSQAFEGANSPAYCDDGSLVYLEDAGGDGLWDIYRNGVDIINTQGPSTAPPIGTAHQQAEYTENDVQCSHGNDLSFTRYADASHPLPSPMSGGTLSVELWTRRVADSDVGTERTFLSGGPGGALPITTVVRAAWSPDGAKLALIGTTTFGGDQLFTMNADGSDVTPIEDTAGPGVPLGLSWSPDTTKVAYVRSDNVVEIATLAGGADTEVPGVVAYGNIDWAAGPGAAVGVPISAPAPPAAPVPTSPTSPAGATPPAAPALVARLGKAPTATTVATLLTGGLPTAVSCNEACSVRSELFVTAAQARRLGLLARRSTRTAPVLVGSTTAKRSSAGSVRVVTKLTAKARKALKRAKGVALTQTVTVTAANGTSVAKRKLTLKAKRP